MLYILLVDYFPAHFDFANLQPHYLPLGFRRWLLYVEKFSDKNIPFTSLMRYTWGCTFERFR